jgi:hypothetical protein
VLQRLSVRAAPITNRVADYGPAVPACCNVCRTCTTTNLVGLALGSVTAAGVWLASVARRRQTSDGGEPALEQAPHRLVR